MSCFNCFVAEVLQYQNLDLKSIITPVKVNIYQKLLNEAGYDKQKTQFLVEGFTNGFSLAIMGLLRLEGKHPTLSSEWDLKLSCGTKS